MRVSIKKVCCLTAVVLAVLIFAGCGVKNETHFFAYEDFGKTKFSDMHYEHYDADALLARIDAFSALAKQKNTGDKLIKEYDEIISELTKLNTLETLSTIYYTQDPNNEKLESEKNYSLENCIRVSDAVMRALRDVLRSENGAALRAHIGAESAKVFLEYEDMSERSKELALEESELVTDHEQLMLNQNTAAIVDGESWTIERLRNERENLDEEKVNEIYDAIEKELNLTAGGIFQELIAIRTEQAKLAGYENYIDYSYTEQYNRDYSKTEVRAFQNTVKKSLGISYYDELYDKTMLIIGGRDCKLNADNVLDYVGKYAKDISSELYSAYKYMLKYELCDFTSDPGKLDRGFTTDLTYYNEPFIYNMCYDGDASTLSGSVHEFGHFVSSHYIPGKNVLTDSLNYDVAEVNSQALELLYDEYYEEIFGKKDAPVIRAQHLESLLSNIIEGCVQDEFQQYAYTHTEATIDELNQAYFDIRKSYGQDYGELDHDYSWMYLSHTFGSPFYYISYATSSLTSLGIWEKAQSDRQEAIEEYLLFTSFGTYDYDYLELLNICGMEDFRDARYVERITKTTKDKILQLLDEAAE